MSPIAVVDKVVEKVGNAASNFMDLFDGDEHGGISQGALAGSMSNLSSVTPGRMTAGATTFTDPSTISANFGGKNMDTMGTGNVDTGFDGDVGDMKKLLTTATLGHDTTKTVNNWISGSTNYGSYIFDE